MSREIVFSLVLICALHIRSSHQQTFILNLQDQTKNIGDTGFFYALLSSPSTESGTWYKDGVQLNPIANKIIIDVSGNVRQIVINNIQPSDAGRYSLRIAGLETSADLIVSGVTITAGLQDRTVQQGTNVELEVRLSQAVSVTDVIWEHYTNRLSNNAKYQITSNGLFHRLTIQNVQQSEAGQYTFTVSTLVTQMTLIVTTTTPTDVDECQLGTDNCHQNAQCTNTVGSFTCSCIPGYTGNGVICNDINECASGATNNCSPNANCANTAGSYTCTCRTGFSGNGFSCSQSDVDECQLGTDNCHSNAQCTNTIGAFTCSCLTGYTGNGIFCSDINECNGPNSCSSLARCDNTQGSYTCTCRDGYSGNGFTCVDINECDLNRDNCSPNARCDNNIGSFTCTCSQGFSGDGITCTPAADVDECALNTDTCSPFAQCRNTIGSYTCTCNTGYVGDGVTCIDVNECAAGTSGCSSNARCDNNQGSYTCTCNQGFTGNGFTCTQPSGATIITQMQNVTVQAGSSFTLFLILSQSNVYTGVWYRNGAPVVNSSNVFTYSSGQYHYLTGFTANPSDAGAYSFQIGGQTTTAYLTVLGGTVPVNGNWGAWFVVNDPSCGITCGSTNTVFQTRNRRCDNPAPSNGGQSCPGQSSDQIRKTCNFNPCPGPVNGNWGAWFVVNDPSCGITCGSTNTVFQTRNRFCNNPAPSNGGQSCPGQSSDQIRKTCNFNPCPALIITVNMTPAAPQVGTNAVFQVQLNQENIQNGIWVKNNVRLFNSTKTLITVNGRLQQLVVTNVQSSDAGVYSYIVNGLNSTSTLTLQGGSGFDQWTAWGGGQTCSVTCGGGSLGQFRSRNCVNTQLPCLGETFEYRTQICNTNLCPVNGNWGAWFVVNDPSCGITCGSTNTVFQTRNRRCNNPAPSNGGQSCPGQSSDQIRKTCNFNPCPGPVNGNWGAWFVVNDPSCGITCGSTNTVFQTRNRRCDNPAPSNGGQSCPGQSSDQIRKTCNFNPCPVLTQDLCSNTQRSNGIGYRYHPTDCDKYIQCYYQPNGNVVGVYRSCPFGYYWDQRTLRCDKSQDVTCPIERCSGKCQPHYRMSGSCRSYWQCENGVSVGRCCMPGFSYEEGEGCRPNYFCQDTCPTSCGEKDVCDKRPTWSGDSASYNISVGLLGWMPTRCISGSYFEIADCGCSPLDSTCQPDVNFNFFDIGSVNRARALWLSDDNVTYSNNAATFNSNSYFFVNITKSTAFPNRPVIIKFRYRETTTSSGRRVLVSTSNCKKDNSLVIAIDDSFMTFEVMSWYGMVVKMSISTAGFSRYSWASVTLMYNGHEMMAALSRDSATYLARAMASDSTIMECGLRVGTDGRLNTPAFQGELEQLTIYRCNPGNVFE